MSILWIRPNLTQLGAWISWYLWCWQRRFSPVPGRGVWHNRHLFIWFIMCNPPTACSVVARALAKTLQQKYTFCTAQTSLIYWWVSVADGGPSLNHHWNIAYRYTQNGGLICCDCDIIIHVSVRKAASSFAGDRTYIVYARFRFRINSFFSGWGRVWAASVMYEKNSQIFQIF